MSRRPLLERLATMAMNHAATEEPLDLEAVHDELSHELFYHQLEPGCSAVHRYLGSPPAAGAPTPPDVANHALECTLCTLRLARDLPGAGTMLDHDDLVADLARQHGPLVDELVQELDRLGGDEEVAAPRAGRRLLEDVARYEPGAGEVLLGYICLRFAALLRDALGVEGQDDQTSVTRFLAEPFQLALASVRSGQLRWRSGHHLDRALLKLLLWKLVRTLRAQGQDWQALDLDARWARWQAERRLLAAPEPPANEDSGQDLAEVTSLFPAAQQAAGMRELSRQLVGVQRSSVQGLRDLVGGANELKMVAGHTPTFEGHREHQDKEVKMLGGPPVPLSAARQDEPLALRVSLVQFRADNRLDVVLEGPGDLTGRAVMLRWKASSVPLAHGAFSRSSSMSTRSRAALVVPLGPGSTRPRDLEPAAVMKGLQISILDDPRLPLGDLLETPDVVAATKRQGEDVPAGPRPVEQLALQMPPPASHAGVLTIIGSGIFPVDIISCPEPGQGLLETTPQLRAGGTCGNVLAICSSLGAEAHAVGRLDAADPVAARLREDLAHWGVKLTHLFPEDSRAVPLIFELVSRPGTPPEQSRHHPLKCPRCAGWLPGYGAVTIAQGKEAWASLPRCDVLFLDRAPPANKVLAGLAAKAGALVVFEPISMPARAQVKNFCEVLRQAHVVKYSGDRPRDFVEADLPRAPLLEVQTLGADGLRYRWQGADWRTLPAFELDDLVDPTGAGDMCTAVFLFLTARGGLARFQELDEGQVRQGLRVAQAAAAWTCRFHGARGAMYQDRFPLADHVRRLLGQDDELTLPAPPRLEDTEDLERTMVRLCPHCREAQQAEQGAPGEEASSPAADITTWRPAGRPGYVGKKVAAAARKLDAEHGAGNWCIAYT